MTDSEACFQQTVHHLSALFLFCTLSLFQFRWTIFNQLAFVVQARPFWFAVWNVDDSPIVEHVAPAPRWKRLAQPSGSAYFDLRATAHVGSKFFLSSSDLKSKSVGNNSIIFLPSSMIGVRQYAQLTLQGSLCLHVFSELSYQPRS